ncbi:MAG: hypothetical protein AAF927_16240 [Bacteroidota bacterium]
MKAELTHDQLASRILAKASAEEKALRKVSKFIANRLDYFQTSQGNLMEAEDLAYINPYLELLTLSSAEKKLIQDSRRALSNRRRILIAGISLAVLFLCFLAAALLQWREAETASQNAQIAFEKADSIRQKADQQSVAIKTASKEVVALIDQAKFETQRANDLRQQAQLLADSARLAERLAGQDFAKAEAARKIAEAAEAKIRKIAIRRQALTFITESSLQLQKGDLRLAYLLAQRAYEMMPSELSERAIQNLLSSPHAFSVRHDAPITGITYLPQAQTLLTASQDANIHYSPLNKPAPNKTLSHLAPVTSLAVSKDESLLLSGTQNGQIYLWDRTSAKLIRKMKHADALLSVAFTDAGKILSTSNRSVKLWDQDGRLLSTIRQSAQIVKAIVAPDEAYILVADAAGVASLWSAQAKLYGQLKHQKAITDIAISPEGDQILTASKDKTAVLWRRRDLKKLYTFSHEDEVVAVAFPASYRDSSLYENDQDRDGIPDLFDQEFTRATALAQGGQVDEDGRLFDDDKDGVPNLYDKQKETPKGAPVDDYGVALDSDQDGVIDLYDQEIDTPEGAKVDDEGRALDGDQDGVIDLYDEQADTPLGAAVDKKGVALDSDGDGVIDIYDQEINSPQGAPVDKEGVVLDTDQDGVIDLYDQEPNTPAGATVDYEGRALDKDQDGVIDLYDQENDTPQGAPVDKQGVALDSDQDGVIDFYDLEPNTTLGKPVDARGRTDTDGDGISDGSDLEEATPDSVLVDAQGRMDEDQDGVPDSRDQEWYTPEGAEVDPQTGRAIDTDGDGLPDFIDYEVNTPKRFLAKTDAFGRRPGIRGEVPALWAADTTRQIEKLPEDEDEVGIPDSYDTESDTPEGTAADPTGRSLDSDGDGFMEPITVYPHFVLLTADASGSVKVWSNQNARLWDYLQVMPTLTQAGFSEDAKHLYALTTEENRLWIRSPQRDSRFFSHPSPVLRFWALDEMFTTGTANGIVRIWQKFPDISETQAILAYFAERFSPLTSAEKAKYGLN